MNSILQLRGQFQKRKNLSSFGPLNLPKNARVNSKHVRKLIQQISEIIEYWEKEKTIGGALVSVHYTCVVAKSNRIQLLLSEAGCRSNDSIRGAKFKETQINGKKPIKHIITHFVSLVALYKTKELLEKSLIVMEQQFDGIISSVETNAINRGSYDDSVIKKSVFLRVMVDAYYVESFRIDCIEESIEETSIITLYKTGVETTELLEKYGINVNPGKMIDDTTLQLSPKEIDILRHNVPYLIAMHVKNFVDIADDINNYSQVMETISIKDPTNEPIIGVIDTQFDEEVYFHKWVNYKPMLQEGIEIEPIDKIHGTAVSSIIVDGPTFNPDLQDNCGHFQVRHFGVSKAKGFNSFSILKMIRKIVSENTDIKVWNLSLGSSMGIKANFISPEAAELDKIQNEYDVIFVVAGTNKVNEKSDDKIGAPADSLNSLVVNSVNYKGEPATYTRVGPVLSFFYKPDVCYYGGDKDKMMVVCEPLGKASVCGTSFAAPWITRKMAYLIYNMGFSREVAKALIIDSAAGWNRMDNKTYAKGYGVVPKDINDILSSRDDEIKFIMSGVIEEYETYTYSIPVPQDKQAHPYFAKATLVYFPKSDRNQGVDYTSTEMDIHIGRIMEKDGKAIIKSIDYNRQADEGINLIYEEDARKLYRKWDNVKHICERIKESARPRKTYESGMWGLSIKTKERLENGAGKGLPFGIVVTLREMYGVNRIDEFIKMCNLKGWFVRRIDVESLNRIYVKADEEIQLE